MEYNKPHKTFQEQVSLLVSRGLVIKDQQKAGNILKQINYYRLRAYTLPFENPPHKFISGTTIEDVISLYNFDEELRKIIFNIIGRIEISLRTIIAYTLSNRYGPFAHESPNNFKRQFYGHSSNNKWNEWILKVHNQAKEKENSEVFIKHFKEKYDEYPKLPVWVMVETISMALLSQLYAGMLKEDQIIVAKEYNIHSEVFTKWIHNFTYIRNICAHHSCLWNKTLSVRLVFPKKPAWDGLNSVKFGPVIFAINTVLASNIFDNDVRVLWRSGMEKLIDNHPDVPNFWQQVGLPENWKEHPLWEG